MADPETPIRYTIGDRVVTREVFERSLMAERKRLVSEVSELFAQVRYLEARLRAVSAENRRLKDVLSEVAQSVAPWKESQE
jgi:L-fucose isomerase-like protein